MKKFNLLLSGILLFCLMSLCGCGSSDSRNTEKAEITEVSNLISEDNNTPEAISYIQRIISEEYPSSKFDGYPQSMEETMTKGRYEIKGQFLVREDKNIFLKFYSTYAQKFDNQWEFGTLLISDTPNPTLANATNIIKGQLKVKEQESINKKEDGSIGGIDYTVIKRNAPNYIIIYTPKRLNRNDIIKLYNEFKDKYESIRFTISKNPNDDDYFCFQYGYVYDYKKNGMYKLNDYLNNQNPKNLFD